MNINSENQLLAIDETCLSELSEEKESTISGGTFFPRFFPFGFPFFGGGFGGQSTAVSNNNNISLNIANVNTNNNNNNFRLF